MDPPRVKGDGSLSPIGCATLTNSTNSAGDEGTVAI